MKTMKMLKIFSYTVLHLFEVAILFLISWWVFTYAPAQYQWPIFLAFLGVYLLYLVASVIDDYKNYKGGDFIIP